MLDRRNHQGRFGEDYVRTIASAAGLVVAEPSVDAFGVDLTIRFPGRVGGIGSPGIDVQVKTTMRPRFVGSDISFRGLDERQFNLLAGEDTVFPRFLFLVLMPSELHRYVSYRSDGILLRHLCYYRSLSNEEPIAEPRRSSHRTVRIPQANVLTVPALLGMIHPDLPALRRAS